MIFQHTLPHVLGGEKTQTRRVISPGDEAVHGPDGAIVAVRHNGRAKWAVGKTYAVQPGRGKPQVARIRITSLRREPVTDISEADALAEGAASPQDFLATWRAIHGEAHMNDAVWVVGFQLVP